MCPKGKRFLGKKTGNAFPKLENFMLPKRKILLGSNGPD
jgi:hypothetical protein